jgi:colanic acid biosynthesis glycosyl transferase WcaI
VILDAAEKLQDRQEIVFLIVGQGSCRDELIADAKRRGLRNVKLLPFQPESEVPEVYAACDVALIPLRHGITENSLPCKTYSIMASGRPYIAGVDNDSTVSKLTDGVGCGVCIAPEDGRALAEAVLQLQADVNARQTMGTAGRNYVELHFAREAITSRYRVALEKLVEGGELPIASQASLSSE